MTDQLASGTEFDPVDCFYEAMRDGDPIRLLESLSEDFVGHVSQGLPGGHGGIHTGRDHMLRDCWIPIHQAFGARPQPADRLAAADGRVVVTGNYHGSSPASGKPFTAAFAHIFSLAEGRITELRQITDTRMWPEAEPKSEQGVPARSSPGQKAQSVDAAPRQDVDGRGQVANPAHGG